MGQTQDISNSSSVSIRYIKEEDYPDILRLSRVPASIVPEFEEDKIELLFYSALENKNSTGIILTVDGVGRGYIFGFITPHYYHSDLIAYCMSIFVEEEYRKYGLEMIKSFEAWGKYKGAKRLSMSTFKGLSPDNLGKVYRKLGYSEKEVIYWKEV